MILLIVDLLDISEVQLTAGNKMNDGRIPAHFCTVSTQLFSSLSTEGVLDLHGFLAFVDHFDDR